MIILMCTKTSQAEQYEPSSRGVFGGLSRRCCSQRQLALSVKQLITQVYHLKEGDKAAHTDMHKHFQRQRHTQVYL